MRGDIPSEDDKIYVKYKIFALNGESVEFCLFVTTRRLMRLCLKVKHLLVDATYKLIIEGYPVIVVGSTDRKKKFFPIGAAVATNENTPSFKFVFESLKLAAEDLLDYEFQPNLLIADAAGAITAGFRAVFGNSFKRVMCWYHTIAAIDRRLQTIKLSEETSEALRSDICKLQICENEAIFNAAFDLFKNKWILEVPDFVEYFENQWFKENKNWYEGFAIGLPSTNNGLESTNDKIKASVDRELNHIGRFLVLLEKTIVHEWSCELNPNQLQPKVFASELTIDMEVWTEAFLLHTDKEKNRKMTINGETFYYIASPYLAGSADFDYAIKAYRMLKGNLSWADFNTFCSYQANIYEVKLHSENYMQSLCTCNDFLKNYICEHILYFAVLSKLCKFPNACKNIPLNKLPKRGRKRKAVKALLHQPTILTKKKNSYIHFFIYIIYINLFKRIEILIIFINTTHLYRFFYFYKFCKLLIKFYKILYNVEQ